jgi:hypothetical protein
MANTFPMLPVLAQFNFGTGHAITFARPNGDELKTVSGNWCDQDVLRWRKSKWSGWLF